MVNHHGFLPFGKFVVLFSEHLKQIQGYEHNLGPICFSFSHFCDRANFIATLFPPVGNSLVFSGEKKVGNPSQMPETLRFRNLRTKFA